MKRTIIGVVLITVGLQIIVATLVIHFKYKDKMNDLLANRVILNESQTEQSSEEVDNELVISDIENFTVEGLTEDQEIGEIKSGTPVISIPSMDILVPVVNGTDDYSLRLGAGKFEHSVDMGETGNFAVAGHSSTIYNCIFNGLEDIELLDVIECYNAEGVLFKYYVINKFKTNPDNIAVTYSSNEPTLTIVTCTDNGTRRFIVVARLMSDEELEEYKHNLKSIYIDKAVKLADKSSTLDILSYFKDSSFITKIPYMINYCNVEEVPNFFTNYIVVKDKLKVNEHNYNVEFNQSLGIDVSNKLSEVSYK